MMKKLLFLMLCLIVTMHGIAQTFNFTHAGQTLKYEVTDLNKKTCGVSRNNVSGEVIIPEKVFDSTSGTQLSVTSIKMNAFFNCSSLTSITIPNTVNEVGVNSFYGCYSLTAISLPISVEIIGRSAFQYCNKITSIEIPKNVKEIGIGAFSYCRALSTITVSPENPYFCAVDGALFDHDITALLVAPCQSSSYSVPSSVTRIGGYAFGGNSKLSTLSLPESLVEIDGGAFIDCTSLSSINLPNSITTIGNGAFFNCTNLQSISIPEGVPNIPYRLFYNCRNLNSVQLPSTISSIGQEAFDGCIKLSTIVLPEAINYIDKGAFQNCMGLMSITIPSNITTIKSNTFNECRKLSEVTLPSSLSQIEDGAFHFCDNLKKITCFSEAPPSCTYSIFFNRTSWEPRNCELYVPQESLSAYRSHSLWQHFITIRAIDIPTDAEAKLYVHDFTIEPGTLFKLLPVHLKSSGSFCAFQTEVILPERLSLVSFNNNPTVELNKSYSTLSNKVFVFAKNNSYQIIATTTDNSSILNRNDEVLFYISVMAYDDFSLTPQNIVFRNTILESDTSQYKIPDSESIINADYNTTGNINIFSESETQYYNLQGIHVSKPKLGEVYIKVIGGKSTKIIF